MSVCGKCYNLLLFSAADKSKLSAMFFSSNNTRTWKQKRINGSALSRKSPEAFNISIIRCVSSWSDVTHYSILGIDYEASQAEIRSAYLKLSKELHPDFNIGKTEKEIESIHNKFVKINEAYGVLGNKKLRASYDLEYLMHQDPRWQGGRGGGSGAGESRGATPFGKRPMTFNERAEQMGFKKQDPNFYAKHGNYHQRVVMWCVVFIAVGIVVQGTAIAALYNRHTSQLDEATAANNQILINARANARNWTVQHQIDNLSRNSVKGVRVLDPVEDVKSA